MKAVKCVSFKFVKQGLCKPLSNLTWVLGLPCFKQEAGLGDPLGLIGGFQFGGRNACQVPSCRFSRFLPFKIQI